MVKCEVLADRISLVIHKGSVVFIDDQQFELARRFLKPVREEKAIEQEEIKPKRTKKK